MALVKCELDTDAKTLSVTVDGEAVDDVSYLTMWASPDSPMFKQDAGFEVNSHKESDNGIRVSTRLQAAINEYFGVKDD